MQKTAQKSQQKSGNLGNGEAVYAFKIARINPENLSVRFWTLGGNVRRFNLACSEVPALVEQIDSAIADGDFCLWFDGARYSVPEKLLRGIRENLLVLAPPTVNGAIHSSYNAVSGGSDAQVVRGGVSTPVKSKAPARAAALPHCASDFNEERDRRIAKASAVRAEPFNGSGTAAADFERQISRIVGDELRKAVMPLLAEIDAIAALVKECAAELAAVSKKFTTRVRIETEKRDRRIAKANAVRAEPFDGSGTAAEGSISTRRGRTSVVVGRRKVS